MDYLGDSRADLASSIRSQHQAALTILAQILQGCTDTLYWLDVACGRGQIINQLEDNIPSLPMRQKIVHTFYDIDRTYTAQTEERAKTLGFQKLDPQVGELKNVKVTLKGVAKYRYITFTNTIHEVNAFEVPLLILDLISLLAPDGQLYMYDMDQLPAKYPELGAVTWDLNGIEKLATFLFSKIGKIQPPLVQRWIHSTTAGWSFIARRDHFIEDFEPHIGDLILGSKQIVAEMLERRLAVTKNALEALTLGSAENEGEREVVIAELYKFWSLSRAIEGGSV